MAEWHGLFGYLSSTLRYKIIGEVPKQTGLNSLGGAVKVSSGLGDILHAYWLVLLEINSPIPFHTLYTK